jgi:hypothetical protein
MSARNIGDEMTAPSPIVFPSDPRALRRVSPNVTSLGYIDMLTIMSPAMI